MERIKIMNKEQVIKNYINSHRKEFYSDTNKKLINAIAIVNGAKETGLSQIDFMSYLRYGKVM